MQFISCDRIFLSTLLSIQFLASTLTGQTITHEDSQISIVGVGDVMLGSWVTSYLRENGARYPFEKTHRYLKSGDVTIANLEAPFTNDGPPFEKKFNFKVPPEFAVGIPAAGIQVVTLANNHIMDYGEAGLISTLAVLDSFGIKHSGAGIDSLAAHQPVVLQAHGKRIAFFGYSMTFPTEFYARGDSAGTAYPEPELMQAMLETWEDSVDFTVASFHWSAEKLDTPKDYQIFFAHLAIDSGADLVLGHHPHVLQGLEIYKNRLIAYSLGNFVFGSYSKDAADSIILKVLLNDDGLVYATCIPINVDNNVVEFQPKILFGQRKQGILSKLRNLSLPLNSEKNIIRDSGLVLGEWASFYDSWLTDMTTASFLNAVFTSFQPADTVRTDSNSSH